ncbi:MAG: winged helix-turn-helix domain-containing protein [Acidobacteriota bacterium]
MSQEFQLGDWLVRPQLNQLVRNGRTIHLQPKAMDLLSFMAKHAGEVLHKEKIVNALWPDTFVTDDALVSVISDLRRALEDDAKNPRYIQTVPRRGYLLLPSVSWSHAAPEQTQTSSFTWRDWRLIGALGVGGLLVLGLWMSHRFGSDESQKSAPPKLVWVMISRFENRTGEKLFDGVLEYALERDISNSRSVSVVSRQRIMDVLRLMRKPEETNIDRNLGREICLRDGNVPFLFSGRIERFGSKYLLSLTLVESSTDRLLSATSAEAPDRSHVLDAVRRLSQWSRTAVGERIDDIPEARRLAKVTTPSLRALQLYSQADLLMDNGGYGSMALAEELLKTITIEDPDFASAHLLLAWTRSNQHKPPAEFPPEAEQAVKLADFSTERERYFILGSYYHMKGEPAKAIPFYEALLAVEPDHAWAPGNLANILKGLGREQESVRLMVQSAELRPHAFGANFAAAEELASVQADWMKAEHFAQQALKAVSPDMLRSVFGSSLSFAHLKFFKAYKHWAHGDLPGALREAHRLGKSAEPLLLGQERLALQRELAFFWELLGKLKESEKLGTDFSLGQRLLRGDVQRARSVVPRSLENAHRNREPNVIFQAARIGRVAEAEQAFERWKESTYAKIGEGLPFKKILEGELALARGRADEAIPLLRQGLQLACRGWPTFFLGSQSLARVLEERGSRSEAIRVLEEAAGERNAAAFRWGGIEWMHTQLQLAQLYQKLGRIEESKKIKSELKKLLAYADPDYGLLRQISKSE